jgi:hypothetical protein
LLAVSSDTPCPHNTLGAHEKNTSLPSRYRYSRFSPLTCRLVPSNDTSMHHCNDALVHFALMMHSTLEGPPRPVGGLQLDTPNSTTNSTQLFRLGQANCRALIERVIGAVCLLGRTNQPGIPRIHGDEAGKRHGHDEAVAKAPASSRGGG